MRIQDEAPLSLVAVLAGEAWVIPDDRAARRLGPGDVAVMRGPDPYTFADDPETPIQVVIHPGQRCTDPHGGELEQAMDLGVRTWGNSPEGSTVMLVGTYQLGGEAGGRLMRVLPPLLVLAADAWDSPLIPLLAEEIVRDESGQEVVLDRLLDLVLIAVLLREPVRPQHRLQAGARRQPPRVPGGRGQPLSHQPQAEAHRHTLAPNTLKTWTIPGSSRPSSRRARVACSARR